MAAPKELKSPASAGRPKNVQSPVPSDESELAAMAALSDSDLADLEAMKSLKMDEPSGPSGIRPQTEQYLSDVGFMRGGQPATPFDQRSPEEIRAQLAEMAGGALTQMPPALVGARMGLQAGSALGMPLVGAGVGSAIGATLGAGFTKDAVNKIRSLMNMPEQEDRSRGMDMLVSGIFGLFGVGSAVGQEMNLLTKEMSAGVQAKWTAEMLRMKNPAVAALGDDTIGGLQLLKAGISEALTPYIGQEAAAQQIANVEDDFLKALNNGLSPAQAASSVGEKYSFQVRANKARSDILTSLGEDVEIQDLLKEGILTNPDQIIGIKQKRARARWGTAFEAIKQTKGLDMVDSQTYIPKLVDARAKAEKIGNTALVRNIDNVINALGQKDKLNELMIFAEQTGGKPPTFVDVKTNKRYKTRQVQERFQTEGQEPVYMATADVSQLPPGAGAGDITFETMLVDRPGVKIGRQQSTPTAQVQPGLPMQMQRPMTKQELASNMLPAKISDGLNSSAMQSIDDIIERRVILDQQIKRMEDGAPKEAAIAAVQALREVENDFMVGLKKMGGDHAKIADDYLAAKADIGFLNDAVDRMESLAKQDTVGLANMLKSTPQDQLNAWAAVMPERVRKTVARKYVEGTLQITDGLPNRPYTDADWKKIEDFITGPSGKEQRAKISSLIGRGAGDQFYRDLSELKNLSQAASRLPEGKPAEMQMSRKASVAIERFVKKYGGNVFFYGRMFKDPDKRAYTDFLNYMMSKDFDTVVNGLATGREMAEAGAELTRLFGRSDPRVANFFEYARSQGKLPYMIAGQAAKAQLVPQYQSQPTGEQ